MALLGMKDQAAAARFSNVGSLGALRLNEEFASLQSTYAVRRLTNSHMPLILRWNARCVGVYSGWCLEVIRLLQ
jgi:hypothetical protein